MTPRQKIVLRQGEVRARLGEISELDDEGFTDAVKTELRALKVELGDLETRSEAALLSEGADEARARGEFGNGDGEPAEIRALFDKVTIGSYLESAKAGGELRGAPVELAAALKVPIAGASGGVAVPWEILETPELRAVQVDVERRAFTSTAQNAGGQMQRPILQRLFGAGVLDALGVRIDTVPVGRTEWPLFSTGVAPSQKVEATAAAAAVAATFSFATLKGKKLTGRYEYTHEQAASVDAVEQSLRRDLGDSIKAQMSALVVNGPAVDPNTASTSANVPGNGGFLVALASALVDDTAVADAARYGRLHADAVDGIHASSETEVMSVIGDETYTHSAGVYITGSGKAGSQLLAERSAGCMASTYIPDASSNIQQAILHGAGPNGGGIMRGDSVAAVWPTLEIIRDPYSKASQGVVLTWVTLWDAHVALREGAYKIRGIQISA